MCVGERGRETAGEAFVIFPLSFQQHKNPEIWQCKSFYCLLSADIFFFFPSELDHCRCNLRKPAKRSVKHTGVPIATSLLIN